MVPTSALPSISRMNFTTGSTTGRMLAERGQEVSLDEAADLAAARDRARP
jgi:hypothetical protein